MFGQSFTTAWKCAQPGQNWNISKSDSIFPFICICFSWEINLGKTTLSKLRTSFKHDLILKPSGLYWTNCRRCLYHPTNCTFLSADCDNSPKAKVAKRLSHGKTKSYVYKLHPCNLGPDEPGCSRSWKSFNRSCSKSKSRSKSKSCSQSESKFHAMRVKVRSGSHFSQSRTWN